METELAIKLQDSGIKYQTQVEIPVTTVDFYFPTEPRPLLVFVDGRVHLGKTQMLKDEELRILLRKRGYRILELSYKSHSDKRRDEFFQEINQQSRNRIARKLPGRVSPAIIQVYIIAHSVYHLDKHDGYDNHTARA